nr:trypsin-like peptidase domain-containing protein [Amycolatopsis nigrescens]
MSQPNSHQDRPGAPQREPRLMPRPVAQPAVDPAQAATFGRPRGVTGAFDRLYAPDARNGKEAEGVTLAPPPPESLAEAFSRPQDTPGVRLQRPRDDNGSGPGGNGAEPPLWSAPADPWRDPGAGAVLGSPALRTDAADDEDEERPKGALLSLPEVLFGRRVKPVALGLLGVVALLVGALGGLVGWWLADTGDSLTGQATIAEAEGGKERAPGSVSDIAKRVAPAVIKIDVTSGPDQPGVTGSGVMIDPQGYALTNAHVIDPAAKDPKMKISAVFVDGSRGEAKLVASDPKTDLAVIKVSVRNPTVMQIGKSADLAVGDSVLAIGSPQRLANTVTQGIVSALNRPVSAGGDPGEALVTYDAIQTDASINPGNSGGALVDSSGALVGINSSIKTGTSNGEGGSVGLGFAIPSDYAINIAQKLIKDGKVQHAEIGINASSVVADTESGAKVQNVVGGGPAAQAGIAEGDVITKVGDRVVRDSPELTVAVRAHNVGDRVPVQLVRQGRPLTVDVTLGSD